MSTLNKVELSTGGVSTVYKIGNVVEGYLDKDNNKFYEDAQYTTEINAESDVVYLSLDTNKQYRYDTTNLVFVSISGGNDDHVYNTKADMLADLANVGDGDIMYTKEDNNDGLSERVTDLETLTGDTDISSIGDGTVTGAIDALSSGGGGGGTTITYTQWQQMTDAQKQAFVGYVSGVPNQTLNAASITYDGTTSGSSNTDVQSELDTINANLSYHLTEHVVGKWIDGTTDVYEKTYTYSGQALPSGETVIDANMTASAITPVGFDCSGFMSNNAFVSLPFIVSSTMQVNVTVASNGLTIYIQDRTITAYTITIRYIKN